MWRTLEQASRVTIAVLAFTMAFLLTPRSWIPGAHAPSNQPQEVPVDTLESPDSCLWCDNPGAHEGTCDGDSDAEHNSSGFHGQECEQDHESGTGPNA